MSQCQPGCLDPNMYATTAMLPPSGDAGMMSPNDMMMSPQQVAAAALDPSTGMMMDPYMAAAAAAALTGAATDTDTYGADEDDEDEQNGKPGEPLACYVCRGRRMCFCYFLKVRYYKFPSFLDLVDHQYKKWRHQMAKSGRQQS